MKSSNTMPTFLISHGGGPWPWLNGPFRDACAKLEAHLKELPSEIGVKPSAILVISGHWEERDFTVMNNPAPPMVYDYSEFPEHTYQIKYQAPGSPELAHRVQALLGEARIPVKLDSKRGFDHGAFTPLAVSFPDADVPVVQLSLRVDHDPEAHLKMGRALAPLRNEGVLIIGSGLSYHNLRLFDARAIKPSHEFDAWLNDALITSTPSERSKRLLQWAKAPSARLAHPEEDHLLPLMVAVGAAEEDKATLCDHEDDFLGGVAVSSFRFGK